MKMEEIRQLSLDELVKRLQDEEESLSNLRFQLATRQLDSPIRVRTVRRGIAQLKSLIRERELAAPPQAAPATAAPATNPQTTEVKAS
jgi:large subunit ribosomal protein L29